MLKRLCLCFLFVGFLTSCDKPVAEFKSTVYVFGTLVEITLRDVDEDEATALVSELQQDFQKLHKDWHAWRDGELMNVNRAIAASEPIEVSDLTLEAIEKAIQYEALSDGYFNAGIGKILDLWGFHSDELPEGKIPPFDEINDMAAKQPRMSDLVVEGNQISSSNRFVHLDFGGFGKGFALDLAEAKLRDAGVKHAVLNAGGDINTLGDHGERPWIMAIRHPFVKWDVIASVKLKPDEELYTSGNYERFLEHEGIKYAHILTPETGMAVTHVVSASVMHNDGALADAAATALTVAGPENWYKVAKQMGIKYALLIDENGTFYLNPAMKERLILPEGLSPEFVLSPPL